MHRTTRIKVFFLPKWRYATCTRKGGAWASHRSHMAGIKGLWTILGSVGDPAEREDLALVATAIQMHFASLDARERSDVELIAIRFRWPDSRTRQRLCTR